jgi:hypothetical protein
MIKFIFMVFVFLIGNTVAVLAEVPGLIELEKSIVQRLRSYDGLEFSVNSSLYQENSSGKIIYSLPTLRETIRLHFPEKGPAWKYWVQEIQDKFDNKWIHNHFKVTNITETRNFKYTPEGEGKWNDGDITPWYDWNGDEGRYLFHFLGMNTTFLSLLVFDISDEFIKQSIEKQSLQFVGEGKCDGIKTFIFRGVHKDLKVYYEAHFTFPQCMVVYFEAKVIEEKNYSTIYRIEKLDFVDGIYYPQKGYLSVAALRYGDKVDYKFEVTEVKRYDPALLNNWFPEWSPSTIVVDVKTDDHITIPPSERQLKKVAEAWTSAANAEQPYWMVTRIVLMILGSILILISLFLMIKKRCKK